MKRTIIRIMGTFIAVFAGLISRTAGAADTIGLTQYTSTTSGGTSCYRYILRDPNKIVCNNYRTCTDGTGNCTYKCSDSGNAYCLWCSCYNSWGDGNEPSRCDTTGFWSPNDYSSSYYSDRTEETCGGTTTYKFYKCDSTAYRTKTTTPCDTSYSTTNLSALQACCVECPKPGAYNAYAAGAPIASSFGAGSNWSYGTSSGNGIGITKCYLIPHMEGVFTDCAGTYTLGGMECPYSSSFSVSSTDNANGCK